jgi:hypothetical protein
MDCGRSSEGFFKPFLATGLHPAQFDTNLMESAMSALAARDGMAQRRARAKVARVDQNGQRLMLFAAASLQFLFLLGLLLLIRP